MIETKQIVTLDKFRYSKFRLKFKLDDNDLCIIDRHGLEKIREHAIDIIKMRLAPAMPIKDGKQTPFKGHPVFKAQHATATCCRTCLAKWHRIPKGRALLNEEIDLVVSYIMLWIKMKQVEQRSNLSFKQMMSPPNPSADH